MPIGLFSCIHTHVTCELRFSASLTRCCCFPLLRNKKDHSENTEATCRIRPVVETLPWKVCLGFIIIFVTNSIHVIVYLMGNQVSQQSEMQELKSNTKSKYACSLRVNSSIWTFFHFLLINTSAEYQDKAIYEQNACVFFLIFKVIDEISHLRTCHHWGSDDIAEQRLPWLRKCFRHALLEKLG